MSYRLIDGLEAKAYLNKGMLIQFVKMGTWFDLTPDELYLLDSNLFIFRLKP